MSTHDGPNIVTDGLVFLFDAGNHKSYPGTGTSSTDIVRRNVGTMTSITVSNGHFNFNGSTSNINFGSVPTVIVDIFDGGGTFSCWVRGETDGEGNFGRIVDTTQSTTQGWHLNAASESGGTIDLQFIQWFTTTSGRWDISGVGLNVWNNITIVYDASSVSNDPTIYLNGAAIAESEVSTPVGSVDTDSGNDLRFGNRTLADRTWDGDIDLVAYWSRMLTAQEVTNNFSVLRGRFDV